MTQSSPYGGQPPYPQQPPPYGQQPGVVQKSKVVAGILGILLGSIGIHNFYLGKTGRGIIQIVVTVVTFGVGGIWGFIEGILILVSKPGTPWHRDAAGVELAD
ncbi:TM2 domain-containing protein [Mycolicibacterium fortuitum]|uniref:TM2 domain-containing protein n=1 Tax=Mycolicibacterium fortuitum TaxID=1766 RepID=UPI003AAB042A